MESLPLRVPNDYAVVYDSTMARFWFFNETAREMVTRALQRIPQGRIVPDEELAEWAISLPTTPLPLVGQLLSLHDFHAGHRANVDGLLQEAEEQFSTGRRTPPIKAEGEFVEVVVQVVRTWGPLVSAQQPAFQQRGDTMHPREQVHGRLRTFTF